MCGRAYETYTDHELAMRYIRGAPPAGIPHLEPVYNLCPTMNSPVLRIVNGQFRVELMYWQLIPMWEPAFKTKLSTINARSETILNSSVFGDVVLRQRCIVPISGFYEWKRDGKVKRPFKIHLKDDPIMSIAGIWETWRAGTPEARSSFSIVTTAANSFMKGIHDRMPVVLSQRDEDEWLDPEVHSPERLQRILKRPPSEILTAVEVSPLVNSAKNNSPDLLDPATPETSAAAPSPRTLFEL
jgi:putative SOS response-associated peptidase YedK